MALEPLDQNHAAQKSLSEQVNAIGAGSHAVRIPVGHHADGSPAVALLNYVATARGAKQVLAAECAWLGGLATGGGGSRSVSFIDGDVRRSKSDVVVRIKTERGTFVDGVSVKTCAKSSPTNAQVYFTTAEAFCARLESAGISVSSVARDSLRMFCGDTGFRPRDLGARTSSPDLDATGWASHRERIDHAARATAVSTEP
jgi:hypothetical protein